MNYISQVDIPLQLIPIIFNLLFNLKIIVRIPNKMYLGTHNYFCAPHDIVNSFAKHFKLVYVNRNENLVVNSPSNIN